MLISSGEFKFLILKNLSKRSSLMTWDFIPKIFFLSLLISSVLIDLRLLSATISYICGCSQSIEPNFGVMFVYSTLSGEFTQINEYFVEAIDDTLTVNIYNYGWQEGWYIYKLNTYNKQMMLFIYGILS